MKLPFLPERFHRVVLAKQDALAVGELARALWRCLAALRTLDPCFDLFRGYDLDYVLVAAEHEDSLRAILSAGQIDWYDRDRPLTEPAYRTRLSTLAEGADYCDLLLSWVPPQQAVKGRAPLALELRLGAEETSTSPARAALLAQAFATLAEVLEPDVGRVEHPLETLRMPHGSGVPSVGWLTLVPQAKSVEARACLADLTLLPLATGAAIAMATDGPPAWDKERTRLELVRQCLMPVLEGRVEPAPAASQAAPAVLVASPSYLQQAAVEAPPARPPLSVNVELAQGASGASLVWQRGGAEYVTFVIKLVLDLGTGQLSEPRPVVQTDVFVLGNANRSLMHANELVPFLPRGEIVVSGHAEVAVRQSRVTSLRVAGEGGVIHKQIVVRSTGLERTHPARIPLQYEGAFGGPGFDRNPVGLGHRGTGVPVLLPPNGQLELVGYGPLSPTWSDRAGLLSRGDRALLARRPMEVPTQLPWDYFHAAPSDQRLDSYFRGNEVITLEGFRDHPLTLALPNVAAMAMLESEDGAREPMQMQLDHVAVDLDEMVGWLVFRGCADASDGRLGSRAKINGAFALAGQARWPTKSRLAAAVVEEETAIPTGSEPSAPVPFREAGAPQAPAAWKKPPWLETSPVAAPAPAEKFAQTVDLPPRKKS